MFSARKVQRTKSGKIKPDPTLRPSVLVPVSNKVRALYALWKQLSADAVRASEEREADRRILEDSEEADGTDKIDVIKEDLDNNNSVLVRFAASNAKDPNPNPNPIDCTNISPIPNPNPTPESSLSNGAVEDWSGIVFCRMRLTALSVHFLLSLLRFAETFHSNTTRNGSTATFDSISAERASSASSPSAAAAVGSPSSSASSYSWETELFRPIHIIGHTKQKLQLETLLQFKLGKYNVLFATDVVEEGLDVKGCQYIINFDLPDTVKSYIQRRGRARGAKPQIGE